MHRVLPPTSTVRLFCTRDPFATPSVDAAVEKGFSTERVQAVAKKAQERNQNEQRGPLSNLSNNFKSEPLVAAGSNGSLWEGTPELLEDHQALRRRQCLEGDPSKRVQLRGPNQGDQRVLKTSWSPPESPSTKAPRAPRQG